MRKLKERGWGKQTLDTKIYPVVSVGARPPLVHVVEALTKSIASQSPSLFQDFLTRHQGSRQVLGHLDAVSTKELLHERRGSPRPPHKAVVTAPHQAGGSMT
jgi:hypothetical protein